MPNAFAYVVLYGYPILVYFMFRHLPPARAVIWTLLIGYLFLPPVPTTANLPILPPLTKVEMPSVSALIMLLWFHGLKWFSFPKSKIVFGLALVYVLSPIATIITNPDPIITGYFSQPGMTLRDLPSAMATKFFFLLPAILAYNILSKPAHLKDILIALIIAGLVYSVPMLLEIRLSPQLNVWVYGFFQHDFSQMVRGNSFRPIVFLYHALWVSFMTLLVGMSAFALHRYGRSQDPLEGGERKFALHPLALLSPFFRKSPRSIYFGLSIFFVVLLLLCRSYGSIIYGLALFPIVALASPRTQVYGAFAMALIVVTYPLTRMMGFFPADQLVDIAQQINAERAHSLAFRFNNELLLMERASERLFLGWGTWGRNMPIHPTSGGFITISDGRWIISLGQFGIVGFVAEMGLFMYPIFAVFYYVLRGGMQGISPYVPVLLLALGINGIDMLPNATITPLTFLFAGALFKHIEGIAERRREIAARAAKRGQFAIGGSEVLPLLPRRLPGPRTVL